MNKLVPIFFVGLFLVAQVDLLAQDSYPYESFMVNSLFSKKIQKEIELVDDQVEQISETLEELKDRHKELGAILQEFKEQGVSEEELELKRESLLEEFDERKQVAQSEVLEVLLPHQRTRLRQLTAQHMNRESAKSSKVKTGLLTTEMKDYLEIDDEQANRLEQRSHEIRKELTEKIKQLQLEAQESILAELSGEQRKKYDELMGSKLN